MALRSRASWVVVLGSIVAGALLNRAALRAPLVLDDYAQRAMIEGTLTPPRGALNLYDFVSDSNRSALLARGAIPWWADSHLTIRFLRPLSSALVWLDYRLFGYGAFYPHLLSLLWWAGVVVMCHAFYRSVVNVRPAVVATAILALSPALSTPLVWLANRDALLSLFFGALALSLYVRWRDHRRSALGVGAGCAFAASLLSGEYAVCLAGYVLAYEVGRREESPRRRFVGLLPVTLPFVTYALTHFALRYGAAGSGFYRDPFAVPGAYLDAMPRVVSTLIRWAWLGFGEDASLPISHPLSISLVVAGIAVVLGAFLAARRESSAASSRTALWLASGSLLSLLPLAAAEPDPRVLGVAALGVSGTLAILIERVWKSLARRQATWPSLLDIAAGTALGYVYLVAAPMEARRLSSNAVDEELRNEQQLTALRRTDRHGDTTLVLRANYPTTVLWTPFFLGEFAPTAWRVLSQTFAQTVIVRTMPKTIEVSEEVGPLFPIGPTDFFRTRALEPGTTIELPAFRATILRVDGDGTPNAVRYEFDRELTDHEFQWIAEGQTGFTDIVPPPVGFGLRLAP
jgi:hypothetical protein